MSTDGSNNLRFSKPKSNAAESAVHCRDAIRRLAIGKPPALDATDLLLLETLRQNGRVSQETLAGILSLSRPAVRERMRRLESSGVLRRYTVDLDWEMLGYPILAFVRVQTDRADCPAAARQVAALSSDEAIVETCQSTTGKWSLFLKVRARTSADLEALLNRIYAAPTCAATATTLVLSTLYSK